MKILVVSPPTFGKHVGGAPKDIFATVGLLQRMGHEVSFWAIGTAGQDATLIQTFEQTYGIKAHVFMPQLKRWGHWLLSLLKNPAYGDRAAYVFLQLTQDPAFTDHFSAWVPEQIMFFCSYGWPVAAFARKHGIPSIFRSHNYEPSFFFEALNVSQKLSPFNWVRFGAKYVGESNAARLSTVIASIPFDEVYKYRRIRQEGIFILTLTYLPEALKSSWVHVGKKPLDIMFLGASYLVTFHLRGAAALIEHIGPEVARRAPGAFRFHICGSKLPQELKAKCDGENIIYEDYVPDLEAFLSTMDIGAFPVWTGKSMKGKVFESLCRGFPVVIPSNCLSGYDLTDKKDVLLAETPNDFVEAILSLQNEALRVELSQHAHEFSQKHFSYEELAGTLSEVIEYAKLASKN